MLQFVCETCGNIREPGEPWILGFAFERLGSTSISRDISFAPAWDENKAVQWFAVHFCSIACKDEYVAKLFGEPAKTVVTETVVAPKKKTTVVKRTTRVAPVKRRRL